MIHLTNPYPNYYHASDDSYDGPDGNSPIGTGATPDEALENYGADLRTMTRCVRPDYWHNGDDWQCLDCAIAKRQQEERENVSGMQA